MTYTISRYEQKGDQLFICLNSGNNPVYLEHFFSETEKLDVEGTIAKLVAELELVDEAYVESTPTVSKMDEIKDLVIDTKKIESEKQTIVSAKLEAIEAPIIEEAITEPVIEEVITEEPIEKPIEEPIIEE